MQIRGLKRSGHHPAIAIIARFLKQPAKIGNGHVTLALKMDHPVALERRHLAAHGFKRQPKIIRHRLPRQRQIEYQRPPRAHKLERRIPPRNDRKQRRDLLTRRLAAQNKHPFPRCVQLIKRHLKQPLCDMRRLKHHPFERFLAETAHDEFRRRHNVIGRCIAPRTAYEIARKQQANHLRAPVFHGLRQRRDPRYDRAHKIHLIPGPDNGLTRLEGAVIFNLFESFEFVRVTTCTNRPMANRTILAMLRVLSQLVLCHKFMFALDLGQG